MKHLNAYRHYLIIACIVAILMVVAQWGEELAWANTSNLQTVPTPTPTSIGGDSGEDNSDEESNNANDGDGIAETGRNEDQNETEIDTFGVVEEAGFQISGLVIDSVSREALGNLKIQLGEEETQTNDRGIFRFRTSTPGMFRLMVVSQEDNLLGRQMLDVSAEDIVDLLIEVNPNEPLPEAENDLDQDFTEDQDFVDIEAETNQREASETSGAATGSLDESNKSSSSMLSLIIVVVIMGVMFSLVFFMRNRDA